MKRFKTLSEAAQKAFSAGFADFVNTAPDELYLPEAPAKMWLKVFRQLNIRMLSDGLPNPDDLFLAVEHLEGHLPPVAQCECCASHH